MAVDFPPIKSTNRITKGNDMKNANFGNMFNSNKLFDRFFRKADGVVWDLMTGNIGIQTEDGIATLEGEGDDAQVNVNMFDEFGFALPAFAQSTKIEDVKAGDIIYKGNRNNVFWVLENKGSGKFRVMSQNGTVTNWTAPKMSMLGFDSGVMVLRSLVNLLPNGEKGVNQMQNMLMPMMLMGDGDMDGMNMDKIMPFMLMQMMNGTSSEGGMGNMMTMMLMSKMFK